MVLPAPPAHALPAQPRWLDKLVVAIELSAQGVLTLVDNAAPTRLREAYLRLHARDPATDVIVDVRRLAELPPGTTLILALKPPIGGDDLDWLNLNRPLVSDRRYNVVLWCEDDAADALARGAPDFFDWISARVDCPPAPAAHAVADVKAAIRARACGIAWAGPGFEETLAAVRPGRKIRRVAVASYQSMIDALTSREPGWLFLEGIDTEFHLRRLRWAMAESGRRAIVFRRSIDWTLPGWRILRAEHEPIVEAVHDLTAAGGTGRLAALTGLDPAACASAGFLLREGIETARLEDLLVAASDPRAALQDLARPLGWPLMALLSEPLPWQISGARQHAFESEAARHERDNDPIVVALRGPLLDPEQWIKLGTSALDAGDFEVAIRWLTMALRSLPTDASPRHIAIVLTQRGKAHRRAGDLASARVDLEQAHIKAWTVGDASLIAASAVELGTVLLYRGQPGRASGYLNLASSTITLLGHEGLTLLLSSLALLPPQHDLGAARQDLERVLSIKQRVFATADLLTNAASLGVLGGMLAMQDDLKGARHYLERSLEAFERSLGPAHPDVGATLRALAIVHRKSGDLVGARAHLERALVIQQAALGPGHPETADTLVTLASVLAASGDLDDARATLTNALAIQEKAFGGDGQLAGAETRRELANVLVAKGDLVGAIEILQQALITLRKIFESDDHPDIASTLRELARLQALQSDLQRAD